MTYTLEVVLCGASLIGVIGGVVGSFALLRRQSLMGDALAHAALPGVCLAFLLTGSKSPLPLLLGALAAGLVGALLMLLVVRFSRVKEDAAIGIVLSVFFGVGIVLLTHIQKLPGGNQSGLDKFLFGQAAGLVREDLVVMGVVGAGVLLVVTLFFKEFQVLTFDRDFAASLGLPVRALEVALTCLLVVVVVTGLQMVGVVLMVATLITPPAAARQWTDRLGRMTALAALLGGASGATGALLSAAVPGLPTGPTIVLVSSLALVISLFLAPRRGLLRSWLRERAVARRIRRENLLKDLYHLGERSGSWAAVNLPEVMGMRGQGGHELLANAAPLLRAGLLQGGGDRLQLTPAGLDEAERVVRKHRLWEVYLTRRLDLPIDHVHRDAEAMEHALTDRAVEELDAQLGRPELDPHGRPIPRERRP